MSREISNCEDVIDSRDVIARIEEFEDKKLTIHDCQQSIRIHQMADQTDQEYIEKIRLIADVCTQFADHLQSNLSD